MSVIYIFVLAIPIITLVTYIYPAFSPFFFHNQFTVITARYLLLNSSYMVQWTNSLILQFPVNSSSTLKFRVIVYNIISQQHNACTCQGVATLAFCFLIVMQFHRTQFWSRYFKWLLVFSKQFNKKTTANIC